MTIVFNLSRNFQLHTPKIIVHTTHKKFTKIHNKYYLRDVPSQILKDSEHDYNRLQTKTMKDTEQEIQ